MSVKQIIVVRKDLNMRKGKMIAQGAHASMAAVFPLYGKPMIVRLLAFAYKVVTNTELRQWLSSSFKKIAVSVDSEDELMSILQQARDAGLDVALITDNGATEFNGVPTRTCIAIGPHFDSKIDSITKHLKLL